MSDFEETPILGQSAQQAEKEQSQPQQQIDADTYQKMMYQRFVGGCRQLNFVDAGSARGISNRVVTEHIEKIAQSKELQMLGEEIQKSIKLGRDRHWINWTTSEKIVSELSELLPDYVSPNCWTSFLTTLGFNVSRYDGSQSEQRYEIRW